MLSGPGDLARIETIVDDSGVAAQIEMAMPGGGRPRQLSVRTILIGVLLAIADDRPAHLTRVHRALVSLPEADRDRLGVTARAPRGDHTLTYRQVERTFSSMAAVMEPATRAAHLAETRTGGGGEDRDALLTALCDALVEASVPEIHKTSASSYAVDWTDYPSSSRPAAKGSEIPAADPDASWGHRKCNTPGTRDELFFGYYAQAVTMVRDEDGPVVPELVRRICLQPCATDPAPVMAALLTAMAASGVAIGDILADSGYAHRVADKWANPLRGIGARLICDLHPSDRGPKGTFAGATVCNGNLYCPATPRALLEIAPLGRGPSAGAVAAHDARTAELARYKLGRVSADDAGGYHRVACPAAAGKLRCPLKPASMDLSLQRPEVLTPPSGHTPPCCIQATITVAPGVGAKTRQKHDYPSAAHRASYARRTGAERTYSTLKDPATTDLRRGWCRMLGRTKNLIMLVCATVVRNLRILAAFERRQDDQARREAQGKPPRTRRRRVAAGVT